MRQIHFLGIVLMLWITTAHASDVKDAIVKIYTIQNSPDYYNPWSMRGPEASTGSGCVIKGKKILTNAHVVGDQTFIQVRRYGDAKRYEARLLSVSHEARRGCRECFMSSSRLNRVYVLVRLCALALPLLSIAVMPGSQPLSC